MNMIENTKKLEAIENPETSIYDIMIISHNS